MRDDASGVLMRDDASSSTPIHLPFLLFVLPQQVCNMRRLFCIVSLIYGASARLGPGVQIEPWKLRSGRRCTAGHCLLLWRRAGS
jgi:hypothetical protein